MVRRKLAEDPHADRACTCLLLDTAIEASAFLLAAALDNTSFFTRMTPAIYFL